MSATCRSSPLKNKKLCSKINLTNLHLGIKRKVSKQEYTKFFTKIRIGSKPQTQSIVPCHSIEASVSIQHENSRLRKLIRSVQAENADLRTKIGKESKLENMLMKKTDKGELTDLSLQKAFEVKLLVETEFLEDKLKQKSSNLDRLRHELQAKSRNIITNEICPSADLYAFLNDKANDKINTLRLKEQTLNNRQSKISKLRENIQQIKVVKQSKNEQIHFLNILIQKTKQNLPIESKFKEENQSGIFGTGSRVMVTSSIEKDISALREQSKAIQKEMQGLMEDKIKEKLSILQVINELQNEIIKMKHLEVRRNIRK